MDAQLDTSGVVLVQRGPKPAMEYRWSDLDAFTQGYVKAMLANGRPLIPLRGDSQNPFRAPRFGDLAPETLARIMEDCARFRAYSQPSPLPSTTAGGHSFWMQRHDYDWAAWRLMADDFRRDFPPTTVALDDAGKVVFQ